MPAPPVIGPLEFLIMEELYDRPMSLDDVAAEMYCATSTVLKYFRLFGKRTRRSHLVLNHGNRATPESDQVELLETMYWFEGHTINSIARELGVNRGTIKVRFQRWNLLQRSQQASNKKAASTRVMSAEARKAASERAKRSWQEGTHMTLGPKKQRAV